jgi:hypothetical protein
MVAKIFFSVFVVLLASSLWLLLRARRGSPDRHFMKIQALLASGMLFGSLPSAFELQSSGLAVGSRIVGGVLLVGTLIQLLRTKRIREREGWLTQQRGSGLHGNSP